MRDLSRGEALLAEILRTRWAPPDAPRIAAAPRACPIAEWRYTVAYHGMAGVALRFHGGLLRQLAPEYGEALAEIQQSNAAREVWVCAETINSLTPLTL